MIKIENVEVFGWDAAIRGMRSPMNSWDKSDTGWIESDCQPPYIDVEFEWMNKKVIGENDLKLMKSLAKAGSDHAKYLRMINVTMDITAPLYWWKEYDTYKVGTVANSCSTMHKIHEKEFTLDDFSCEHLFTDQVLNMKGFDPMNPLCFFSQTIIVLNFYREKYIEAKKGVTSIDAIEAKDYWWQMIQLLPSSYNQKRTVQLNYEVLRNMYFARKNHKLDEWLVLCEFIVNKLPYFKEIFEIE